MQKLIFDVDGTLTPSRGIIDPEFKQFMLDLSSNIDCFLVTGSDQIKTIQQIGEELYNSMKKVYQCAGNAVYTDVNTCIKINEFNPSQELLDDLKQELNNNKFPIKTGNHIEIRTGLVNFSICGRNVTLEEREKYVAWDTEKEERLKITNRLSSKYKGITFDVAGETGIDIFPNGRDKSQILKDFDISNDNIYFFGDAIYPGGNDFTIATQLGIYINTVYAVKDWKHTWDILQELKDI